MQKRSEMHELKEEVKSTLVSMAAATKMYRFHIRLYGPIRNLARFFAAVLVVILLALTATQNVSPLSFEGMSLFFLSTFLVPAALLVHKTKLKTAIEQHKEFRSITKRLWRLYFNWPRGHESQFVQRVHKAIAVADHIYTTRYAYEEGQLFYFYASAVEQELKADFCGKTELRKPTQRHSFKKAR